MCLGLETKHERDPRLIGFHPRPEFGALNNQQIPECYAPAADFQSLQMLQRGRMISFADVAEPHRTAGQGRP